MTKSSTRRRLTDAYGFAGFRPLENIKGVFGDRYARVVTLVRRSKKRCAVHAGESTSSGTTDDTGECATCRTEICGSIWTSKSGVYVVELVAS
jgi:hypothetical protein